MMLVNFGCGAVAHPDWVNLDAVPAAAGVGRCDVRERLPFGDTTVDAVYHSHLLEHLDAATARSFLHECRRILAPGGTIRVVVPDLEAIVRSYLRELEVVAAGGDTTLYEWNRLELCDQLARATTGGEMRSFVKGLNPQQLAMVRSRAGREVDSILNMSAGIARRRRPTAAKVWWHLRAKIAEGCAFVLGGRRMRAMFAEGWFRQTGEVHRVMYDHVSLGRLLLECGFRDAGATTAVASRIAGFEAYRLDAVDGVVRKPDSLFMEATRP